MSNCCDNELPAGPIAAKAAIVTASQNPSTSRLWSSTKRVSAFMGSPSGSRALGEVTIQAYCVLDAYLNGFAFQEKTVSFKTAEEAAVLAREEVRKFAALAEERPYPPKLWAAGGDEPVFLVDGGCVHAGAHLAPPGCRRVDVLVSQDVGRPVSVLDDRLHRGARGAAAGGVDRH